MENLNKLTGVLLQWLQEIKEGAASQAPELIRQVIAYELYSSVVWLVACTFAFLFLTAFTVYIVRKTKDISNYLFLIFAVPLLIPILFQVNNIVKVKVAPKLFAIEYLMNALRDNK